MIPIGFTILLLFVRIILTGELTYIFLAWNLFLALIPFALSHRLHHIQGKWIPLYVIGLWLLFLPNAPYIITDFLHLKHRVPVPYWYDILLLFSAALNGLFLGIASLLKVEKFLSLRFGKKISGLFILCSLFLCALGIYIGRFLRWNSWDIFISPDNILFEILTFVKDPLGHFKTWGVTLLFGAFFCTIYYTVKSLSTNKSNQF